MNPPTPNYAQRKKPDGVHILPFHLHIIVERMEITVLESRAVCVWNWSGGF